MRTSLFGLALVAVLTAPVVSSAQVPSPPPSSSASASAPQEDAASDAASDAEPAPRIFVPPPIKQEFPPPPERPKHRKFRRPREEMDAREGEKPPPEFHEVRKFQRYPFAIGPVFFGVSYILSAVGAGIGANQSGRRDLWQWMYIPVVGPIITLDQARPTFSNDIDALLVTTVGVFQTAGLGLTIAGFFLPKRVYWEMDDSAKKDWDRREKEWDSEQDELEKIEDRERELRERSRSTSGVTFTLQPLVLPGGGGFGMSGSW